MHQFQRKIYNNKKLCSKNKNNNAKEIISYSSEMKENYGNLRPNVFSNDHFQISRRNRAN